MIHLFVTLKGRAISRYDLEGDEVRIGRHPDNPVQLESMAVSRYHCLLRRDPAAGAWTVEDLGTPNGTFLNQSRLEGQTRVRNGDVLGVGQFQVSVRTEAPSESSMTLGAQSPELLEQAAKARGHLELRDRPDAPVLLERDLTQLGADPAADVPVAGPRKQALLVRGYGGFQVVNTGPDGSGVRVDGHPVSDRAWLTDGAELEVGDLRCVFRVGAPGGEDTTIQIRPSQLGIPNPGWKRKQ